jgi:hypothetical protein
MHEVHFPRPALNIAIGAGTAWNFCSRYTISIKQLIELSVCSLIRTTEQQSHLRREKEDVFDSTFTGSLNF